MVQSVMADRKCHHPDHDKAILYTTFTYLLNVPGFEGVNLTDTVKIPLPEREQLALQLLANVNSLGLTYDAAITASRDALILYLKDKLTGELTVYDLVPRGKYTVPM